MAGKYTRVGAKKGPLVIGGALARFDQEPDFHYVPMYRVAGNKEEVTQWLQENHPDELKSAMKSSYSGQSLKSSSTIRKAFEDEVNAASKERHEAASYRSAMKQVDLSILVKLLNIYEKNKKLAPPVSNSGDKKTIKSLKDKLQEIKTEKKFLDVSTMKEKGTDGKKVDMKKGSLKRHLSQDTGDLLHHVVYNPSSKTAVSGVINFMRVYGTFSDSQISRVKETLESGNMVNLNKTRSPARSPLISPKRGRKSAKSKKTEVTDSGGDDLEDLLDSLPGN